MVKRMIARLLIITQIYSNLFQGIVHAATLVEEAHYHRPMLERADEPEQPTPPPSFEDAHISSFTHLYSEINQRGELQFALGDGSFKAPRVFTIPALESHDDVLEYGGVTVKSQSTSFRFQGLQVSINRAGVMVVEGCQTDHHNPIFLASNQPIILSNIEASGLSIAAPRIVHSGISTIAQLKFEGMGTAEGDAFFVNAGQLTAKELFLNHLNSVNGGGISATRFAVDGQLSSTGSINSSELILEESAFLKLTETSRADIKTLFLSQASHLENHATTHTASIGVLDGLGGSLTNHGSLMIAEVAADSAFQAITNRHFLDIALGTIQAQQFENFGTFISSQSDLQVVDGQNLGALKAKGLLVKTAFTNTATGVVDTPLVSGSGHLRNLGKIETEETLGLAIKRFSNSGLVKAQSVIGWIPDVSASLSGLEQLDNAEDGAIEATRGICFTESTQVNNFGKLQTEDMALYSDKTLQKGDLIARTLNLIGRTFLNQGEITVDHLTAENGLINQASLITGKSTDFGAGGLTNERKAKAQLKGLGLSGDTKITNHGKLAIDGVDTSLGILQITNTGTGTGTATIDAGHALPSNSALISATGVAIGAESGRVSAPARVPIYDPEFTALINILDARKLGSKYKRQALGIPENKGYDPEFNGLGLLDIRKAGTRYKYQALGHENESMIDPEFRTLSRARETAAKYKSEVLGQDPIQGDPEFYTLSQAREAGAKYKAQVKLDLEAKRDQLKQERSQLPAIDTGGLDHPIMRTAHNITEARRIGDKALRELDLFLKRPVAPGFDHPTIRAARNISEMRRIGNQALRELDLVKKLGDQYLPQKAQALQVDQELQKIQKELSETRWSFGLTLQERQISEAQLEADRAQLAIETFKVRLQVVNQASGKLTLRSGHFDLTGDQALLNDGVLTQEAAQLEWADPTTWSNPRSFNNGTWRVKGSLSLMGNADKDVGKLLVEDGMHVDVPAIGSRVLRGQIETTDFSASGGIELFGSLLIRKLTQLQGLTIATDAVADLKGLGLSGDTKITNHGTLAINGVDTTLGILQITNTSAATAIIDAGNALPSSSALISAPRSGLDVTPAETTACVSDFEFRGKTAYQLKEIAVRYKQELGFDDATVGDKEFSGKTPYQLKEIAVRYKNLIHETQLTVDPEFRTLSKAREAAAKYKSEVLGQDPIQGDPEFYTLSQAREAGARYKAQAKLALETKRDQLQQQKARFPTDKGGIDPEFVPMNPSVAKARASQYKRQVLGIPENGKLDPEFVPMNPTVAKIRASQYKFYAQNPQSYAADQELQKVQKELAETRWNFGLTLQERQLREAQLEADRAQLATETFKVRLSVANQSTGNLTLRSGHFDLTGDQALVNDGFLYQEGAYLQWADPTTWSQPRSFNAGTWRVEGTLTLLGNGAKDVGKLEVEDGLHVHTAEIGSRVLRGQIVTADFSAGSGIDLFGSLTTHRSTQLQGLTIAADAVANLKSLKLTGGEISNLGKLRVIGVDTSGGVIKLTNGGSAMIDDQRVLPKLDEYSPENLARVGTGARAVTWDSSSIDNEFSDYSQITHKRAGSKYLRLCKALGAKEPYAVDHYKIEPEFTSSNGLSLKQLATRQKRAFIKLYESEVAKSQNEGSAAEQAELQQYLKQFEPAYQQILASRAAYAKSLHPATGSALVVESTQIPAVKLQLLNQTPGQLTLKSGRFEFVGDAALVNDGTLVQESAYTLWLNSAPGEFNRGTWQVKGSLGLPGYYQAKLGKLQVAGALFIENAGHYAMTTLDNLAQAQATRVSLKSYYLTENDELPADKKIAVARQAKTYPWPLELLLSSSVTNVFDISAPVLKIKSQTFKTTGNVYAYAGALDLDATGWEIVVNHAFLGGRDGVTVRSKTLGILANKVATGAAVPNILYKRPELGLYSEAGPVVVNVTELITCHYGDIKGTYFTITAPQLINTAGLICATEPGLKSVLNVKSVKHVRDDQSSYTSYSYQYGVTYNADGKDWCHCCGTRPWRCGNGCRKQIANTNYYETSGEAILFAQGDLDVTYETLEMLVSSITSLGTLKLVSKGASLDVPNLAVGAELPALPGTTTMTKRNGHVNRIVAKKGLLADVGTADMAADMRGENIHVKAALVTLRSLGIAPQQQAQFIDLFTQENSSSALQMVGASGGRSGRYVDTVLPLRHKAIPDSLVVLGPDATRQMHSGAMLDVQMSMRAMEEIMGNQIYTLIRGVSGLGLSIPDFFKATSSFVRSHKDTVSQRRLIKAGEDQQEVEVQFNATLTPKDLVASGLPAVFMQFSETINILEAEQDVLAAVKSKPRIMMGFPADDAERGIVAEKTVVLESASDLSVATSVKAKDLVAIVAQDTLTVASDVIHHQSGENYTQTLDRTTVAADKVLIQGHDVHLKSIDTHSAQRTDIIATGGSVVDEAVPLVSYRVDRYHSKDESTTVRTTHVHQTTSSHRSDGVAAITAPVGILQQGTHLANARLEAPVVIQDAVHDQHIVDIETIRHKKAGGIFGSWFGITERKTTHSSSAASIARGGINAGREFIANATTRFRAFAPSFTAERSDITALQIELTTGVSQSQSFTQSTYQGPVWNKSSVSTESHTTHCNPTFEHNVYLHSPSVILERVSGSVGTFDRVISDTPVQFRDVDDSHEHTHQSQKSLSAGATLILSLAVTIATMNPTAAMSTMGIEGVMLSAAYGTLCSQTAICLVEKDGNLGKAIDELGRRDIGKSLLISAASAGLTKGLGDKLGITGSTAFDNLAKKHLLQSAINTTLSVAIDGQRPEDAIKQGLTSAAINTLAAYAAGKIGDVRSTSAETRGGADRIDAGTHKLLHGILGAGSGALAGAITQQDIGRFALSGGVGAVLGETFAELTRSKELGDLLATSLAFGTGLDSIIAYQTSHNATEYNFSAHDFVEAHQANLVWDEEDVADGAEVVAKAANKRLDAITDRADRAWDYLAMLEQRHGFSTYSGYDMDGMEYTPGSTTFRSGTHILVDFLKVPETPNLAALHLMTVIPGAGKVVGAGVQGAFTMGERAARWVAPRASATLKPLLERTGQLSERVRTSAPKVMEHVKAHVREQLEYFPRAAAVRHELRAQGYSDRAINRMLAKGAYPTPTPSTTLEALAVRHGAPAPQMSSTAGILMESAAAENRAIRSALSECRVTRPAVKTFEAEDAWLLRGDKAPYHPRTMEAILHQRYGADAVSSSTLLGGTERNVRLAGQRHPVTGVVFDMKGSPIFDDVARFDVKLPRELALGAASDAHKSASTRILAEAIQGNPQLAAKFTDSQIAAINAGKARIPEYVWHHHQDIGRMQLVPKDIHKYTGHVGEDLWQRGLDNAK